MTWYCGGTSNKRAKMGLIFRGFRFFIRTEYKMVTFVYFPNEYFEWLIYPRFSLHASTKVIFSFSSKKNMKAKKKKTKERTAFGFYTFFYFQQQDDIKESKCKQKMRINRGRWLTSGHRTRQMGFLLLFSKYNNNKY